MMASKPSSCLHGTRWHVTNESEILKERKRCSSYNGLVHSSTMISSFLYVLFGVLVLAATMSVVSATEIDNDLVFDDVISPDHHRQSHHKLPHHQTSPAKFHKRLHHSAAGTDHQAVSPVQSPLEEPRLRTNTEEDSGVLGALKEFGTRVKRQLWGFPKLDFNLFGTKTKTRTTTGTTEEGTTTERPLEEEEGNEILPQATTPASIPESYRERRSTVNEEDDEEFEGVNEVTLDEDLRGDVGVDDEDAFAEVSGDGVEHGSGVLLSPDGVKDKPRQPDRDDRTQSHVFRTTFSIHEPYKDEFNNTSSPQFHALSQNLSYAVNALYEDLPGQQLAQVVKIQKTDDPFLCTVMLDLMSVDYYDNNVIRERLKQHIDNYRKLGSVSATTDNFSFREFSAALPSTTIAPVTTVTISPDEILSPAPIDRCRADDKVRCADGSVFICTVQVCDGEPDCPGGDDEKDCPSENACAEGEFMCDLTRCIPANKRCDSAPDCTDGTDEQDCQPPARPAGACRSDEFRCRDGNCLEFFRRCDFVMDCIGGEDEHGCPNACTPDEFQCSDGNCIESRKKCDGRADCSDYSDENNCSRRACEPSTEWQCDDGTCIDRRNKCNRHSDCPNDDSDERNCHGGCSANEFQCRDRTCIRSSLRCDHRQDCPDGTDEQNCGHASCEQDQFRCNDGLCLNINQRCNNKEECVTGEDERGCFICTANEFNCKDGRCVDLKVRCDGNQDCGDASDEENCGNMVAPCPSSDFTCQDGSCVPMSRRCDGIPDCPNGADETDCEDEDDCKDGEFRCKDGSCILETFVCDSVVDCVDNSDEQNCPSANATTCRPDDIVCGDGKCFEKSRKCDEIWDCVDGVDERDCGVCSPSEFRCESGTCIPEDKRCDSHRDCIDGTDELDCECLSDQFRCDNGVCISDAYRCDGYEDCTDRSDELGCPSSGCSIIEFTCRDKSCIPLPKVCDRVRDCSDGLDEADCPPLEPKTCSPSEYTCQDGPCIDRSRVCDGRSDCRDGGDEANCGCHSDEFHCRSGECVHIDVRCNRRYDCRDGSDEQGCEVQTPAPPTPPPRPSHHECPSGQTACRTGNQCILSSAMCNGRIDCQDFSDEANCAGNTDGLNLRTYPDDQIIKESREVVFQCRDEGPLRARVHWIRGNGLPLPPGSRDVSGRLEIPDIQVEHSGTYICEAQGFPQGTPGARVSVHLQVEAFTPPPTRPPSACGLTEATCTNGECISKHLVCNGAYDCSDGSDEMRCSPHGCEPNQFRCKNKRCIMKTWMCDSEDDCGDNSDEENCGTNPPGSPCRINEYQCRDGQQCIPKNFHCDHSSDCLDGSDEIGCTAPVIKIPPPPMVISNIGDVLTITCTAIGVPTPEVIWRLNWGHIPEKCSYTSNKGFGTLTCPDVQESDQGAYSCEAINSKSSTFAVPDSILVVKKPESVCPTGYFNEEASIPSDCISCFCFGVTTECDSADLYTYQLPPPLDQYKFVGVKVNPSTGYVEVRSEPSRTSFRPLSHNGFQVYSSPSERSEDNVYPYFSLPENFHGNQLKSYGGYLKYNVKYEGQGRPVAAPSVILSGNGYTLVHSGRQPIAGRDNDVSVRFFYGEWYKRTGARRGGDIPSGPQDLLATREEIMMALGNTDNILIRAQYIDGPLDTTILSIAMDSAGIRNTGQGQSTYVEECRCPAGYTGLSCEQCAPGFNRHRSGPWLGLCTKEPETCSPGTYGAPSRNVPCQACPCPLTNPANQFGRTCLLDTDGQVTCDCPQGYVGRRCEQCAAGYQGNPFTPGDSCTQGLCDVAGSLSPQPDQSTGQCSCKDHVTGSTCNQCKTSAFHLDVNNQFGCISCFCTGITGQCQSSNWYRQQVSAAFTRNTQDFKLVEALKKQEPITDGIRLDSNTREIVFEDFSRRSPDVYYWLLPAQFLGDKVTSYGGHLNYTVRYVPAPGGQSSRNNAPDVELISSNDIRLLYFGRDQIEPNRPQSISVPLFEQHWQRHDGQTANREHLLMALADLEAILIKATYTTNTREAALVQVILDVAQERNTGQQRAFEVEQCQCPRGYRGLSCQDCDVGFTRSEEGLYLGLCEPCNCNSHSTECDPETGACVNCDDHTTGEQCEVCEDGYDGDATGGSRLDCQATGERPQPGCDCDPRGSNNNDCPDGNQCVCKTNVEGRRCDRCRKGTFSLSSANTEGCLECFCSGATDSCQPSNLYRTQIPMQIIDQHHGFTLTDSNRNQVIRDGFLLNVAQNEIGYTFPGGRNQRLFWSLPPAFTGNKVESYGGNLSMTQHYTARAGAERSYDTDVVIMGNGVSIYWTFTGNVEPDQSLTLSVPLRETSWRRLGQSGPHTASRADLLTVLSSVEAILVRASHSTQTLSTYLSDVSLDTAVSNYAGQPIATEVEACRCPTGYRGFSCEACSPGYYRDPSDQSTSVLGSCVRCPCQGREESCSPSPDGRVHCVCQPGFVGPSCENVEEETTVRPEVGPEPDRRPPPPQQPTITITMTEPTIQIVEAGSTVRYRCSGRSVTHRPVTIHWSKEHGVLPKERAIDDNQGLLVITDVRVSDSGTYICAASDGLTIATERAVLTVGGSAPTPPQISISPRYLEVGEGKPVEFHCQASGNPAPDLRWTRGQNRPLSPEYSFRNGIFRIQSARKSDESEYECHATNPSGTDTVSTVLYVREGQPSQEPPVRLTVEPSDYSGPGGETIRLTCLVEGHGRQYNIRWARSGGQELPPSAVQRDGVLTIYNASPADSGVYVCTASSTGTGTIGEVQSRVTIVSHRAPPTVRIEPDRQTVSQGTMGELRCIASGDPTPQIRWSKVGEELGSNIQVTGSQVRILNALVRDRGVYVCTAENAGGTAQASAIVEVERREPPAVQLYPESSQTVTTGGSTLLQCRVTGGIPSPRLRWSRKDGQPLTTNVEQLAGGVLRFNHVTAAEGGQYVCHAENDAGMTSAVGTLLIQSVPRITLSPSTTVQTTVGDRVKLECHATGEPHPTVAWSKHKPGYSFYDAQTVTAETPQTAIYEITRVTKADEGSYSCLARNAAGATEERLHLVVEEDNSITGGGHQGRGDIPGGGDDDVPSPEYDGSDRGRPTQGSAGQGQPPTHGGGTPGRRPPSRPFSPPDGSVQVSDDVFRVPVGGRAEMRCFISERGKHERIFLNWVRSDKQPMPYGYLVREGILYINDVQPTAAGEYACLGVGPSGNVIFTVKARLMVIAPPRIQLNPTRQVVRPGDNAYITCSATGDQPIDIQWSALGRALPSTVSTNQGYLQFQGIAVSDAGRYICRAQNSAGEAEAAAEVIVNENQQHQQPTVTAVQRDQTAFEGSSVTLRCVVPSDDSGRAHEVSWSRNRKTLPSNGEVLTLRNVRVADEGRYVCEVRTEGGVASDYIDLHVDHLERVGCGTGAFQCRSEECVPLTEVCNGYYDCRDGSDEEACPPRKQRGVSNVALRIDASRDDVHIGDTIDVRCSASSDIPVSFTWNKVGDRLANNVQVVDNLLRISEVRPINGGVYRCSARSRTGSYEEDYILTIRDSDYVNHDAAAVETRRAPYGSTVVMDCRTALEPPVKFGWSKQGGILPKDSNSQAATLHIPDVRAQDAGTYVCTADNGDVRVNIPTVLVVTGVVPYFAQAPTSYMVLPTLPDAYLQFNIEISFRPQSPNGLILYNGQQKGGAGDFISLGLNNSIVEFRFDFGLGPTVIRSEQPISMGEWHTAKLFRNRKEGNLYVDEEGPWKALAHGRFVGLDLVEPLYVGGVPEFGDIHKLNGFSRGFVGCISRLVLGVVEHELVRDATASHGVTTCETCAEKPCHHNGICQEAAQAQGYVCICPAGFSGLNCTKVGEACYPGACGQGRCVNKDEGFSCQCPFGKAGPRCEEEIHITEPAFSDDAYIAYPTPRATNKRLKVVMKLNPTNLDDGLLLYSAQNKDGKGDFTSLAIRDRRLEFRFDTGSGPAVIRSEQDLVPGEWVNVSVGRNSREGHLTVNNGPPITGQSPGPTRGLDLRTPLYVGGFDRHRVKLSQGVGVDRGFQGCVSEIQVAGLDLDIVSSVVDSANVQDCSSISGVPCDRNPCLNGGQCRGSGSQYSCSCQQGFSGQNCENEADVCHMLQPCHNGGSCVGTSSSYKCRCPLGYGGSNCQNTVDFDTEVNFQGDGYVELSNALLPHKFATDSENITIDFTTSEPQGVIFWHGQTPNTDGKGQDYFVLAVVNGILEMSYELGSGPAQIQATGARVDDGRRHRVVLKRQGSDGSIQLDEGVTEFGKSLGILEMLNTRGNIYIGGLPNLDLMTAGKYYRGFSGCIHSLQIMNPGSLNLRELAISAVNVLPCSNEQSDEANSILNSLDNIAHK